MSAIDYLLGSFEREAELVTRPTVDAAKAELSALRRELADAEATLRAVFGPDTAHRGFRPRQVYTVTEFDGDGKRMLAFVFHSGIGDCRVPIDGTGLPVLTDEARAALRGEGKQL